MAALVVAFLVLRVSLKLGWRAICELLDAAPSGLAERLTAEAASVPGVQEVGAVRVRQAGPATFADMTIMVDRSVSLEESHQVATAVEERIGALLDEADVVVHVDPTRRTGESLPQTVSAIAAGLTLRAHNIHAHELRGRYFVDLHVEVPPDLTLEQAHERVARLEDEVRKELPHVSDIHTHIEPMAVPVASAAFDDGRGSPAEPDDRRRRQFRNGEEGVPGLYGCHDLHFRPGPDGYDVVLHCRADPSLPIVQAHQLADQAEKLLYAQVPGIDQVLIHVEPGGEG